MTRLVIGLALTLVFVTSAVVALFWLPVDPQVFDIPNRFHAPSPTYPLGTDQYGRDVLSMLMQGAQTSLAVAFAAVFIGVGIGVPLGLAAAAYPHILGGVILRGSDIIFAFPSILLAVLIAAIAGPGALNAVIAVGIFNIPVFAQLTRGAARSIWTREYVLSARTLGKGPLAISRTHILPNIAGLIAVQASIQVALGIGAEAALSYIGLGAQPPQASWGRMLAEAQTLFVFAPWLLIFPGIAIVLAVLGFNLLGQGLKARFDGPARALDPHALPADAV